MKNSLRRLIGIVSILAVILSIVALPAFAAVPNVTVTMAATDKVLAAGETHNFSLTFRNNEAAGTGGLIGRGSDVDVLQIASPTFLLDPTTFVVPATIGSFKTFVDDGTITLYDGTLAPQATLTVPFTAKVRDTFSTDKGSRFFAQASAVGDSALGAVNCPTGQTGCLDFIVDILRVDSIALTQPASVAGFGGQTPPIEPTGVTDNTVTASQSNVTIQVGVTNLGNAAKDITATLTGVTGSGTINVPAKSSGTITITNVAFGTSNVTVDATATANGADRAANADPAQVAVTVQAAPNFTKKSDVQPDYVGLGAHSLNLPLNKLGVPAVRFSGSVTTQSKDAQGNPAGPSFTFTDLIVNRSPQDYTLIAPLNFGQLVSGLPQYAPGFYDVTLNITSGIDDNGKALPTTPPILVDMGDIFFDPLAPVFTLLTFAGETPFVGSRDAVTHNESFTYNLTLKNDGTAGAGPCASCPVTLKIVDADNPTVVLATKNVTTNATGQSSGGVTGTWPQLAHRDVKLLASGRDRGGNDSIPAESFATVSPTDPTTKVSLIDTLPPAINPAAPTLYGADRVKAYTGGYDGAENRSVIDVVFDEPVAPAGSVGTNAADWKVDDKPGGVVRAVTDARAITFGSGATAVYGVRLTLNEELGKNERPGVAYDKAAVSGNIRDRVEQNLINGALQTVIDNIDPLLPLLDQVDGQAKYTDNAFHTNLGHYTSARDDTLVGNEELVLNLSRVEGGATVVIEEVTQNGVRKLAEAENASTAETITQEIRIPVGTLGTLPNVGQRQTRTLRVYAIDSSQNSSPVDTLTVYFDRQAPTSAGVPNVDPADTANTVTIRASEPLRNGRNDPIDWKVRINFDGIVFNVGIETVTTTENPAERVLKVSGQYNLAVAEEVEHARFAYVGDANARLVDPAGNRLPLTLNFLNSAHANNP